MAAARSPGARQCFLYSVRSLHSVRMYQMRYHVQAEGNLLEHAVWLILVSLWKAPLSLRLDSVLLKIVPVSSLDAWSVKSMAIGSRADYCNNHYRLWNCIQSCVGQRMDEPHCTSPMRIQAVLTTNEPTVQRSSQRTRERAVWLTLMVLWRDPLSLKVDSLLLEIAFAWLLAVWAVALRVLESKAGYCSNR